MNSVRCLTLLKHTTLLCAALALSLGSASAQISAAPDFSSSTAVSSSESSSNTLQLVNDAGAPADEVSGADALPAAPSPHGSGGGQYDNRGGGGGGASGIRSHLTYEVGGGFNAPSSDSSPYITWGGNVTVGGGYRFNQNLSLMLEYQFIDDKLPGVIIAEAGATGGHDHIWSLSLDPVYEFNPKSAIGFYATGGIRILSEGDKLHRSTAILLLRLLLRLLPHNAECRGRTLLEQPGRVEHWRRPRASLRGMERRRQDEDLCRSTLSRCAFASGD